MGAPTMTGRRFGRRGTGIGLVLLGLGTALGERIAFGTIIPALAFDGSAVSFLSTAALTAAGWMAWPCRDAFDRRAEPIKVGRGRRTCHSRMPGKFLIKTLSYLTHPLR